MKRVSDAREPPVVIPVVVVLVHVHVLLVVPAVEGRHDVHNTVSTTAPRILSGLYRIRHSNAIVSCTK